MPRPNPAEGFYATVDRKTGFMRDIRYMEGRQEAHAGLTSNYTEALKRQVCVRRVAVTLVEPLDLSMKDHRDLPPKKTKDKKTSSSTPHAHRSNTWSFSLHGAGGPLDDLQKDRLYWIGTDVFPFLEYEGNVYRRLTPTTCEAMYLAYDDLLREADQAAVDTVMAGAKDWDRIHEVIHALRAQAQARFGKDFADPAYDV